MSDWLNKFVAEKKMEEQPLVEEEIEEHAEMLQSIVLEHIREVE